MILHVSDEARGSQGELIVAGPAVGSGIKHDSIRFNVSMLVSVINRLLDCGKRLCQRSVALGAAQTVWLHIIWNKSED